MQNISTIREAGDAIRSGRVSIPELVEHYLYRIRLLDSRLKAWVVVDEQGALQQSHELQTRLDDEEDLGILHGIPIGIKDIVDVQGLPTEAGSSLRCQAIAHTDAPVVKSLRAQGAVLLGKTVTTELACFDPPPTLNPWNAEHTPGGSSSGSAAAVATRMCLAAVGSQTGGSITRPASYCGVCGWKPSFGFPTMKGIVPVSFSLDHVGIIAGNVADLASFSSVFSANLNSSKRREHQATRLPPRIGVLESYFLEHSDVDTRAMLDSVVQELRQAGATVEAVGLPVGFDRVHEMHRRLMAVEAAYAHGDDFDEHRLCFGRAVASLIREGREYSKAEYVEAIHFRQTFCTAATEVVSEYDSLLTPSTPTAAPADLTTTGDPRFNAPWSFSGLPTVSMPCRLDGQGMPIGIQLVGRHGGDYDLLAIANWCENRLPFTHTVPIKS